VQRELNKRGHKTERQKWIDIFFKGELLEDKYRIDMLIDDKIIIEFKMVPDLDDTHARQILVI
jgi:GxxExxY protein